jgi:hypothetical protein
MFTWSAGIAIFLTVASVLQAARNHLQRQQAQLPGEGIAVKLTKGPDRDPDVRGL